MNELVAALRERLDGCRQQRHAHPEALVEGDVDLGDRRQPAIRVRIGADHLDIEAGHAAVADLVEGVGHAVHAAQAVRHQGDAPGLRLAGDELGLLATEEGGGRRVGNGRYAGVENGSCRRSVALPTPSGAEHAVHRLAQPPLVGPAGAAAQVGAREALLLHPGDQLVLGHPQVERVEPRSQERACILGTEVGRERTRELGNSRARRRRWRAVRGAATAKNGWARAQAIPFPCRYSAHCSRSPACAWSQS